MIAPDSKRSGFSLVEVVVAVGILAAAIVAVLGLLAPTGTSIAEVRDADDATRVISAVQAQLQTAGYRATLGWLEAGDAVFATRDGSRLAPGEAAEWTSLSGGDGAKFFEIHLLRNETLSRKEDDDTAGFLAFNVRVRWPAYLPDGTPFSDAQKSVMLVPMAVTR